MGKRKYLLLTPDFKEMLSGLSNADVGNIVIALLKYVSDGTQPDKESFPYSANWNDFKIYADTQDKYLRHIGKRHWNWKGGVTPENAKIRASSEYVHWRKDVFVRDGFTCQMCGRFGCKLNAHHIKPFSKYPDLRLDINNGITLCEKCHKKIHKGVK